MISIRLPNWKRFSLRTMFVLMTVCCSCYGFVRTLENQRRRQRSCAVSPRLPVTHAVRRIGRRTANLLPTTRGKLKKPMVRSQIAVIKADGTDIRLLGPGAMPSWSPDGKQLVCHTYSRPTTIVVMNPDGSGREAIINHWGSPRWSPKGNRIASILNGGIALHDLATGTERVNFSRPVQLAAWILDLAGRLAVLLWRSTERPAGGDARRAHDDSQCAPAAQAGRGRPYVLGSRRPASCILLAPRPTRTVSCMSWTSIAKTRRSCCRARTQTATIRTPIGPPTARQLFSPAGLPLNRHEMKE